MVEIDILARIVVAAILLWAAAAKVVARDPERLEPYGVPRALRSPGYFGLALVEAAVGAALLAGLSFAPLVAIALGVLFTLALARARARGFRRLDCGCFGSKERRVEVLIVRALAFTAAAGLAAFPLEVSRPSAQALVVSALVILTVAVVALAALVLALYRQVGLLTLRVGPGVALELAEEGPPLRAAASVASSHRACARSGAKAWPFTSSTRTRPRKRSSAGQFRGRPSRSISWTG